MLTTYRTPLLSSMLFCSITAQAANFHQLSANECAALATYSQIVAEQRDAGRVVADVLKENFAARTEFATDDLFGAAVDMVQWIFERSSVEPGMAFEIVWHKCAENGGRLPIRQVSGDA